jgi:hypothetical protein
MKVRFVTTFILRVCNVQGPIFGVFLRSSSADVIRRSAGYGIAEV